MDGIASDRWNMLHPDEKKSISYIEQCFKNKDEIFVAATDYLKTLPCTIAKWLPGRLTSLGTDGFGRSDSRSALRDYFEVDSRYIVLAALGALVDESKIERKICEQAIKDMQIDPEKINPVLI